jgi:hypothetical protein
MYISDSHLPLEGRTLIVPTFMYAILTPNTHNEDAENEHEQIEIIL